MIRKKTCACRIKRRPWSSCFTLIRGTRRAAACWRLVAESARKTVTLARNSPEAFITSIDISEASIAAARRAVAANGNTNVDFLQADIFDLPFPADFFDHVFVCFVLEHLARPVEALRELSKVLKPRGTITLIEGDHGSTYFHPKSEAADKAIRCLVDLQARAGGNALVGRQVYPLLRQAGFDSVRVSPRMVYVDASKPELIDGFTIRTFTAMVAGIRENALSAGMIDQATFDTAIVDLNRTTREDGVFCYTFFKGTAVKC